MSTSPSSTLQRAARPDGALRTAILVLGMHRSGTSAVARLLNLRGAGLGRDLLPAKSDNERGFWENRAVVELHERVLAGLGQRWHDLVPPGQAPGIAAGPEFAAALPAVLAAQFDASTLFLVKDPRLSLLVPAWKETLAALAIHPAFVITIRHPNEVAASLERRDALPRVQSQLLWLQHLVEAERATRGHARVFVHYERLLADWQAELDRITRVLDLAWPETTPGFADAAAAFIAPALRHHRGDDAGKLPALLERVYQCACAAAADRSADFAAATSGYDEMIQFAAPLQHALAGRAADAEARHGDEIARARASVDDLAGQLGSARAGIDDLAGQLGSARSNIEALVGELAQSRDAVAAKDAELDDARAHIDALVRELAAARDVVAAKDEEIEAARRNIDALGTELALARESSALQAQELEAARGRIEALGADLGRARESHELKTREIDAARTNIDSLAAEIDAARANIDSLVAEIDRARQAHGARDVTEAALRDDLSTLRQSRWFRLGRRLRVIGGPEA